MKAAEIFDRIRSVKHAIGVLRKGGILIFPTDTAYGLGCDATNSRAVRLISRIKGRPQNKAMPMLVADIKMAKKFFKMEAQHLSLARSYWPGPLSIVFPVHGKNIAKQALYKNTAAVRVPKSHVARALSYGVNKPLIATSANVSGKRTCYSINAIERQFARYLRAAQKRELGKIPVFALDLGLLPRRRPSTIVRVGKRGTIDVLRYGSVRIPNIKSHISRP